MLGQIVGGILIVGCGACIMYFANTIAEIFGWSAWTHKYFGGTRNATLTLGFVVMVVGFLIMFGVFEPSVDGVGSLQYQ